MVKTLLDMSELQTVARDEKIEVDALVEESAADLARPKACSRSGIQMDSALCRRLKQTRFVLKGSEKVRISRILCAENGHAFSKEDGWWSRNRVPVYRTR